MKKLFNIAAAGALLLVAPVQAEEADMGGRDRESLKGLMQRLDKDGDGRLTPEEAKAGPAWLREKFDQIDSDGDGTVEWGELRDHHIPWVAEKRSKKWIKTLDKDGDGKISRQEAEAGPHWIKGKFDPINTDGDDTLELEELKRHIEGWMRSRYEETSD